MAYHHPDWLPFSCACHSAKNNLTVTYKNFEGEIGQQQNLVFAFNKDIYPDSLLQFWDSTAHVEFSPAIKGVFKWNSSSELLFSPAESFQPGTLYLATIITLVLKKNSQQYPMDDNMVLHFHTAPLRVVNTHLS